VARLGWRDEGLAPFVAWRSAQTLKILASQVASDNGAAARLLVEGGIMQDVEQQRFLPRAEDEHTYFRFQLGLAQWDENDRSIGYAWENRNHQHGRGTEFEIPEDVFPHLVAYAMRYGYLSWDAVVRSAVQLEQDLEA
jgi:hypothetical protein